MILIEVLKLIFRNVLFLFRIILKTDEKDIRYDIIIYNIMHCFLWIHVMKDTVVTIDIKKDVDSSVYVYFENRNMSDINKLYGKTKFFF